eukprot:CAMPEP_0201507294 /NCGR_PEP_ID=MMETSP0161_2-20130828/996_1 /ASSEMBLY_ACC=CAM_ASM_000251 /TAXON_ID=180227 /ORGANISM="Neoparamoeba aestuarina, Strain SoJaBio B1-5/56/2" /LENGTH=98 /DNA_ID=CAMNT_0047901615 /DNA_START=159 /DNA_END=455 /DNA_ORIENTATION=+
MSEPVKVKERGNSVVTLREGSELRRSDVYSFSFADENKGKNFYYTKTEVDNNNCSSSIDEEKELLKFCIDFSKEERDIMKRREKSKEGGKLTVWYQFK